MKSSVVKRSIVIAGHKTSVSLEDAFWQTFKEIATFPDDEAGRMLRFVADVARTVGLDDYRVLVNVGAGAGQTNTLSVRKIP